MGEGAGDKNIITMLLIFLTAGVFVGVVGRSSAQSVAYFMLSLIPARFAVAVLFVVACFVSTAMGTSVGTITLITPIAVEVAAASGFSMPLCVGSVMGGAMFGDNLSFISDTTIAACNGQGVPMRDKFRENFWIALPAALATLVVILILSFNAPLGGAVIKPYSLIQIIPYVLVLIGGIAGINVFVVLLVGIVSGAIIMLATGQTVVAEMLVNVGSGVSGMFETSMVAILVSAMCALIRVHGGFEALLSFIRRVFKGRKGGQLGMGLLVGAMDIATANNTVAIVMANPIAKEMSEEYGIAPRKAASLLDTFSCIFQGVIPYGAQMLVAISTTMELGYEISAMEVIPNLFYPFLLLVSSLIFIFLVPQRKKKLNNSPEETCPTNRRAAGHACGAFLSGTGNCFVCLGVADLERLETGKGQIFVHIDPVGQTQGRRPQGRFRPLRSGLGPAGKGVLEGLLQLGAEGVVGLRNVGRPVRFQKPADFRHGKHLLEQRHQQQSRQMGAGVPLLHRRFHQMLLDVVVNHGGRENGVVRAGIQGPQHLIRHGNHLIHIEIQRGQFLKPRQMERKQLLHRPGIQKSVQKTSSSLPCSYYNWC